MPDVGVCVRACVHALRFCFTWSHNVGLAVLELRAVLLPQPFAVLGLQHEPPHCHAPIVLTVTVGLRDMDMKRRFCS